MPGGDRTGPLGHGPMTGRAAGLCAGYPNPRYAPLGLGRGQGRGFGRGFWGCGRGLRWRRYYGDSYYPTPFYRGSYPEPSKEEEISYLEDTVKELEEELKAAKDRIQELSKEKKES